MSTKRTIPCAHCGEPAPLNRLKLFRTIWRNGNRVRPGAGHMIHAACWNAFELHQARCLSLESFVRENMHRGFIIRLALAPYLFRKKWQVTNFKAALSGVLRWIFRKP